MKKLNIFVLSFALTTSVMAQERVVQLPLPENQPEQGAWMIDTKIDANIVLPTLPDMTPAAAPVRLNAQKKVANTTTKQAGYLNPEGTFFLGMDGDGNGTWMTRSGIIGAWQADGVWVWPNMVDLAEGSVEYDNYYSLRMPDEYFGMNERGDMLDTLSAAGGLQRYYNGFNTRYYWYYNTPVQTVTWNDGSTSSFQLLSAKKNPALTDAENAAYTVAGMPNPQQADGLWPLTQAACIGTNGDIALYEKNSLKETEYLFGSTPVVLKYDTTIEHGTFYEYIQTEEIEKIDTTLVKDSSIVMVFGQPTWKYFTRTQYDTTYKMDTIEYYEKEVYTPVEMTYPTSMITRYDSLQGKSLFIGSIALWVGADTLQNMKIDNLMAVVRTQSGEILSLTTGTIKDMKNLQYGSQGKMVIFDLSEKDKYGTVIQDGLTLTEPFEIEIMGFAQWDNFGIWSAPVTARGCQTRMIYDDGKSHSTTAYEPFVMLNGIYTTLELYPIWNNISVRADSLLNDTVPIDMSLVRSPHYQYVASYAEGRVEGGQTFEFYSTWTPYDSASMFWQMDIERPEYIVMSPDAWRNLSTADNPVYLFDYLRVFDLNIYATETPMVGDEIKIGKAGREIVFKIVSVNGAADKVAKRATKFLNKNNIYVHRGENVYDILGNKLQ